MENIVYKKILFTHDGSPLASAALPHAITLAYLCEAQVVLLQVVKSVEQEMSFISSPAVNMYPIAYGKELINVVKAHVRSAKGQLEKIKKEFEEHGVNHVSILVEEGFPEDSIVDAAKQEHCDLIVMSTQGRAGLKRAFLGSVTDHVIRHAPCPVLVVHPE